MDLLKRYVWRSDTKREHSFKISENKMEDELTELQDIDLDEDASVTLETVKDFNSFESPEIEVPEEFFEDKTTEELMMLHSDDEDEEEETEVEEGDTALPGITFVDDRDVEVSSKVICPKCNKLFIKMQMFTKHEKVCGEC